MDNRLSTNIEKAKSQTRSIAGAINGNSAAVQTLGSIGSDPHPERLLAVALAHSENALAFLIEEVEALRTEVEVLENSRRR